MFNSKFGFFSSSSNPMSSSPSFPSMVKEKAGKSFLLSKVGGGSGAAKLSKSLKLDVSFFSGTLASKLKSLKLERPFYPLLEKISKNTSDKSLLEAILM